jgi:hypothetical protein
MSPAAKLSVEKVFKEQRRVGFFRVRLLTLQVAQGVRIELLEQGGGTNWQQGFYFKPGLAEKASDIEWREVSIVVAPETTPRLSAVRMEPPCTAHPGACVLEGVTLHGGFGEIKIPQARLVLSGQAAWVESESAGKTERWDLFTGNPISDNTIDQERNHS